MILKARRTQFVLAAALLAALYLVLAYGLYFTLTQRVPGANDFYSRWAGARALFLKGENPYSDAVTGEIQIGMYGRLAQPDEDQVAFAYPLYTAFVVAPLVALTYAQAQALWMALLVMGVVIAGVTLARVFGIGLSPIVLASLVFGGLLFYPSVRGIFLGQFGLVSFFCLVLALAAIQARWDIAAGALLALATVKPQPALFLVPSLIVWAGVQRRWRIVGSASGLWFALVALALAWVPTWPLDFVEGIRQYAQYEPVGPPVQTLSEWLAPSFSFALTLLVSAALIAWMLWRVIRTLNESWANFLPTLGLVALVTTLAAGRMGTPDQVLLAIPWMCWIGRWWRRGEMGWVVVSALTLLILPWMFFLFTLRGNTENVVVTLVLPLLTLAVYAWQSRRAALNPIGVTA